MDRRFEIGVAIPAHNRLERTRECLIALRNSRGHGELFAVLVDDGSRDGTAETIRSEFPEVMRAGGRWFPVVVWGDESGRVRVSQPWM